MFAHQHIRNYQQITDKDGVEKEVLGLVSQKIVQLFVE